MAAGVLVALTLPGLVVVATVEHAWSRLGRRSPLHGRRRAVRGGEGRVLGSGVVYLGPR